MKCIDENAPDDVLRIVVANKCDLHDQFVISSEEGRRLAERYQVDYFETSAKSDVKSNVMNMFHHTAEKLLQRKQTSIRPTPIELTKTPLNQMTTSCCSSWK